MTNRKVSFGNLDDLERWRALVEHMSALGGEFEWGAAQIASRLEAIPDARLARRDDAVAALASQYVGARWTVARHAATELKRYAATAWVRGDRHATVCPIAYASQPRKRACFEALRANGGETLGQKQISRILEMQANSIAYRGHHEGVSMSKQHAHLSNQDREALRMNAVTSHSEFVDLLKRSPDGRRIVEGEAARVVDERKRLVDALRALDAKAPSEFTKLDKAVTAAIADVRAAEIALKAANETLRLAGLAKSGASLAYDSERLRIEAALRDSPAAKQIDGFCSEMLDALYATSAQHEGGYIFDTPLGGGDHVRRGYTNWESVRARLDAIHRALAEAEALRLEADQSNLELALQALRAGLPAVKPAQYPKTFADMAREDEARNGRAA